MGGSPKTPEPVDNTDLKKQREEEKRRNEATLRARRKRGVGVNDLMPGDLTAFNPNAGKTVG